MIDGIARREFLVTPLLFSLAAAGMTPATATAVELEAGKILVAYFSRSGNTRVVANQVSRTLKADSFEILPKNPYPDDYFETVQQAKKEIERRYEPPLRKKVADMISYRTVFLAFPIWGMTLPPLVRSFLSSHDLSGKTIIPLITHGGYGLGDSLDIIAHKARQANLLEGFSMQAPKERQTIERIMAWLQATP